MRQTSQTRNSPGEKIVKDTKRATRKHCSSEEKIRIALDAARGEYSTAENERWASPIALYQPHNLPGGDSLNKSRPDQ